MARLRDDYEKFARRGVQVVAIGPDGPAAFTQYWRRERIPFVGLPDPDHKVARAFGQEVNLLKLGRMPLVAVVDADGVIRYAHHGASMADIPRNATLLQLIDRLNASGSEDTRAAGMAPR